jgi:hypothetical protein
MNIGIEAMDGNNCSFIKWDGSIGSILMCLGRPGCELYSIKKAWFTVDFHFLLGCWLANKYY